MMKARIFLGLLLLACLTTSYGQYKPPSARNRGGGDIMDRLYFGGGGGFSGGSGFLNLSVSPLVGYKVTEQFSAGLQVTYQYVKQGDIKLNAFGGGPFLRYNFTEKLFGYTQYEHLRFKFNTGPDQTYTFNSWFVGLGYTEPIGRNFAFNITALYNLLYKDGSRSPYDSPLVFRVGIVGGL